MTTLGQRCVGVAMQEFEAGVREEPPGSNSGPRVREYLAPCVRGDKNAKLHLVASNWCAALASWCCYQVLRETDTAPPHGYRAGVVEMVADARDPNAKWTGDWKDVELVRLGQWVPKVGDLAIYDRSQPGRPDTAWWRHVNRVVKFDEDADLFHTIGGNERQRVSLSSQSIYKENLLGFIAYPQYDYCRNKKLLSSGEREHLVHLVYMTIDGMIRESVWEQKEEDD